MTALVEGCRVWLVGLTSNTALNGAEGIIMAEPEGDPLRYPVHLLSPEAMVVAHPDGVRVKKQNLETVVKSEEKEPEPSKAKKTVKKKNKKQDKQGDEEEEEEEVQRAQPSAPAAPSSAAPSTGGPRAGGGSSSAGGRPGQHYMDNIFGAGPLTLELRTAMATMCVDMFMDAVKADLYPAEAMEQTFGVKKEPSHRAAGGGGFSMDLSGWPMGNLTFGAWTTIRNWFLEERLVRYMDVKEGDDDAGFDVVAAKERAALERAYRELKDEVVGALLGGRLPQWYERELRRLQREGKASYYAAEIIDRGFRGIAWDTVMHRRLAGQA